MEGDGDDNSRIVTVPHHTKAPNPSSPLSKIEGKAHILLFDIHSYVHRSAEQRNLEIATSKTPGKIKRPMNAFMLYRKAYQRIAIEKCGKPNQQMVSQVCGKSWLLEPDYIRVQFKEWAKHESDNHQKAHPRYKFITSKQQKMKSSRGPGKGRHERQDNGPRDLDLQRSRIKQKTDLLGENIKQSTYVSRDNNEHSRTDFWQQHQHDSQFGQKLEPSLLPAGSGDQLVDLSDHGGYQYQLDRVLSYSWDDSLGQQHLNQTMSFNLEQYAVAGEEFGDSSELLESPEEQKFFDHELWQVFDSYAPDGDDGDNVEGLRA